tara:strand:+ start:701 stop:970 length:270 start_codon:yes stop_codon:yes gene_type:complete
MNIRSEEIKKDYDKKIKKWKEESEDTYISLTNEICYHFTIEEAQYDNLTKIEDAIFDNPYKVLREIREQKRDSVEQIRLLQEMEDGVDY